MPSPLLALWLPILLLAPSSPGDLTLKVSTHSGRVPLELTLNGDLKGTLPEGATCRLRIDRLYTSPGGLQYNERDEQPCTAEPEALLTSTTFEKKLMLKEPGDYSIRIILKPADGREMAGTTQDVKVYHSLEVGAQGTGTQQPRR